MYDLKGSMFGRYTKGQKVAKTMRKDIDFLSDKKEYKELLSFSPVNRSILSILRRDVKFLQLKGLLDYSLLLSVEQTEEEFTTEKIIEDRNAIAALMRRKSRYTKMFRSGKLLDRRLSGKTDLRENTLMPRVDTLGKSSKSFVKVGKQADDVKSEVSIQAEEVEIEEELPFHKIQVKRTPDAEP